MKRILCLGLLALAGCTQADPTRGDDFPVPAIDWAPREYECLRTETPPVIDGRIDDLAWSGFGGSWTEDFDDITGDPQKPARFRTRAKMVWDDTHLYLAFDLEEPHVQGTLTERDCVIFDDNDIEVFLDPDGDTHEYYEIELNALNTVWDLLIPKPYRDGGHGVNAWDIRGMKTAVHVDGTLNDPTDTDRGWTVEMAIPWGPLVEALPVKGPPKDGDVWRVNFSRVQWRTKVVDGKYVKETDPRTGDPLPEDNWSWSPQGLVAMHYPEMWGFLKFRENFTIEIGGGIVPRDTSEWDLRRVYYAQQRYRARRARFGKYARTLSELGMKDQPSRVRMQATDHLFEAELSRPDGVTLRITQDGRLRRIRPEEKESD